MARRAPPDTIGQLLLITAELEIAPLDHRDAHGGGSRGGPKQWTLMVSEEIDVSCLFWWFTGEKS
jgi:hypothetical protein